MYFNGTTDIIDIQNLKMFKMESKTESKIFDQLVIEVPQTTRDHVRTVVDAMEGEPIRRIPLTPLVQNALENKMLSIGIEVCEAANQSLSNELNALKERQRHVETLLERVNTERRVYSEALGEKPQVASYGIAILEGSDFSFEKGALNHIQTDATMNRFVMQLCEIQNALNALPHFSPFEVAKHRTRI